VSAHLDITGLNRLVVEMATTTGRVGAAAAMAVRKTAYDIEGTSKMFCPVDTGNLRASISTTISGGGRLGQIQAEIGPTASYGAFVEFGTSRMAPHAYMGPAFDRHAHQLPTAFGKLGLAA
jgi:HK97 gp10 family phage protein